MTAAAAAPSLSDRLAFAVGLVIRGIGLSLPKGPDAITFGPRALAAWTRLKRLAARFTTLVAALEAGRFSAPRRRAEGASQSRSRSPEDQLPKVRLPGGYGWLLSFAPALETRIGRSQIEHLLGDPEMVALLTQAPQTGRILRPLCHMLRIEIPPSLRLPPRPRSDPTGGTEVEATDGEAPPMQAARPPRPSWMTWAASPPLPGLEDEPAFPPLYPARTGPPDS